MPKISLLACLTFPILLNFYSSLVSQVTYQNWLLTCLILEMAMKKTLKSGFGRQPPQHFQFVHTISFSYIRVKSHTNNQPPSLAILHFPGWVGWLLELRLTQLD